MNAAKNYYLGVSCYFLPFSAYSPQNQAWVFDVPKVWNCAIFMPIVFHRQGQPRKHPCRMLASPLQNRLHTTGSTHLISRLGSLPICLGRQFRNFSTGWPTFQLVIWAWSSGAWSVQSPEARTSTYTSWHRYGATVLDAPATTILYTFSSHDQPNLEALLTSKCRRP